MQYQRAFRRIGDIVQFLKMENCGCFLQKIDCLQEVLQPGTGFRIGLKASQTDISKGIGERAVFCIEGSTVSEILQLSKKIKSSQT